MPWVSVLLIVSRLRLLTVAPPRRVGGVAGSRPGTPDLAWESPRMATKATQTPQRVAGFASVHGCASIALVTVDTKTSRVPARIAEQRTMQYRFILCMIHPQYLYVSY